MIQRFIPAVMGITILISGCANNPDQQRMGDFRDGATLLKVAHLPSPTADGSPLFITVDGKEAGALPVGEAMLLQVPAGEHQVGGYARSLISYVTLPAIKVTTSSDKPHFVAYKVTQNDPLFSERNVDPLPESAPIPVKKPKPKLVGRSDPVPVPQIIKLSMVENEPDVVLSDTPSASQTASQDSSHSASTTDSQGSSTATTSDAAKGTTSGTSTPSTVTQSGQTSAVTTSSETGQGTTSGAATSSTVTQSGQTPAAATSSVTGQGTISGASTSSTVSPSGQTTTVTTSPATTTSEVTSDTSSATSSSAAAAQ